MLSRRALLAARAIPRRWQRSRVVLKAYRGFEVPAPDADAAAAADAARRAALGRLRAWGAACEARPSVRATIVDPERLVANNIGYAENTATSNCAQTVRAAAGIAAGGGASAAQRGALVAAPLALGLLLILLKARPAK